MMSDEPLLFSSLIEFRRFRNEMLHVQGLLALVQRSHFRAPEER